MNVIYRVIALLGGLSMFLYGMRLMGDGLKQSSGGAMKAALAKVTNKPAIGFIFGMLVTCMIQSSTATIVLTVGLVGAGFLSFRQSVGIVLGANVGTAITAQIIRLMDINAGSSSILYFFKADNLAPVALIIGIICLMFIKTDTAGNVGTILVGFGILFMGLIYMSSAVSEMGESLSRLLTAFEDNYFLGFLSGVLVTGIIQSSSAVVGILQSMASSVGVSFCGVFAVIIGVNIGDCITTFLVSRIGAKPEQIRTATVHVIYNIFAALLIAACITIGRATGLIGDSLWYAELNSGGVANVHGAFRLIPAIIFLPLSPMIAALAEKIVPDKAIDSEDQDIENNLRELDSHLLSNPSLALDQSGHLIGHMADVALHNIEASRDQVFAFDPKRSERIVSRENLLDRMADSSNRYIVDLSPHITKDVQLRKQSFQIKALTAFERIGDLAVNMENDVLNMRRQDVHFSDAAIGELKIVFDAILKILKESTIAYKKDDPALAREIEPLEEVIDDLIEAIRSRHIFRMTHHLCDVYAGIQYENILSNLERVSDQCSDMAVFLISSHDPSITGQEHQYIHNLHHSNNPDYIAAYSRQYESYFTRLNAVPNTALPEASPAPSGEGQ